MTNRAGSSRARKPGSRAVRAKAAAPQAGDETPVDETTTVGRRARVRTAQQDSGAAAGLFTTPDGAEVYFEDSGGPGPVLFYIYGLGCSICHWKYPMAHFAAEAAEAAGRRPHRQVWMDFRGHGRSPPPAAGERLTIDRIVGDIRALCEHRGIKRATFLGQSMGGSIALALAHAAPELAQGLVLLTSPGRDVGTFLPMQPFTSWVWKGLIELNRQVPLAFKLFNAATAPLRHSPLVVMPLREAVRQNGFNPALTRTEDIDEYVGKILEIDPNLFLDMAGELSAFDVARLSRPIACPSLVVAGAKDQVVPLAESVRLARHLPRGELVVVPHGSHCPHFDDPGFVNRHVEAFLDEHTL